MKELNRIKSLINKVETKNFVIKEQEDPGLVGGLWDIATGAVSGLYDGAKDVVNKSIPYLVDKTKGVKLLQLKPFSGKLDTVINSASKLFVNQLSSRIDSNTELYNSLVILQNLVSGAESNSIVDKKGLDFKVWEVLEAFTVGVYFASRNQEFTYEKFWDKIESDKIDDYSDSVIDYVEGAIMELSIGGTAQNIKEWYPNFFDSGQSMSAFWNTDRLDGDWDTSEIPLLINSIDMSKYEGKIQSEFETKLSGDISCYTTGGLKFAKIGGSEVDNAAIRTEKNWITIFYYNKSGVLTANIYYKKVNSQPVAITTDIDCGSRGTVVRNVQGLNETLSYSLSKNLLNEQEDVEDVMIGDIRVGVNRKAYNHMLSLYRKANNIEAPSDDTKSSPEDSKSSPEDTTTDKEVSSKSDSGVETPPVVDPEKTNIEKLIDILVEKGGNPREHYEKDSTRASIGSVALGSEVSSEEYLKDEETVYAQKVIEKLNNGSFVIKKYDEDEKDEKEEERIIDATSKISNPTPLELKKIEEIGDDAVAKTNNKLSFDKNRIKNVRVTSNESKVIYIATEDITDILSNIEGELEQVFGGDWMLDKSRNRLFSSNKIYIFTKKEQ
jgi:hypothetical protein